MADLRFEARLEWSGLGKDGEGKATLNGETLVVSAPASMGGKGVGASPEDLLIGAVSSCYSGTLLGVLKRTGLAASSVQVRAEGIITDYPMRAKFSRLIVHPTITGGEPARQSEYEQAATTAREKCFIGKTIAGNISYEVGEVRVLPD
ncbi:MAG TPA: OsmC family protein [Bacilli bacterium]